MQLQRSAGASLAAVYHLLGHLEFTDAQATQLLLDLQTLALAFLREGVAQTSVENVYRTLGHFPRAYLESGLL